MTIKGKRHLYLIGGWIFFVLGVLGLFLPILQGILFLLLSLVLLAKAQPRFRLLKQRVRRKYPKYAKLMGQAEARAAALAKGKFFRKRS